MSLTINGKITQIFNVESGTGKNGKEWKRQNFMLDTGAQFNPTVVFGLFGEDKITMLSNFSVGQEVEVSFNISSREFNGKFYHNIDAWKIGAAGAAQPQSSAPSYADIPPPAPEADNEEDDLPF